MNFNNMNGNEFCGYDEFSQMNIRNNDISSMPNINNTSYTNNQNINRNNNFYNMINNEEIISFNQAVNLIKKLIDDEKEDERFYNLLIKQAQTEKEKNIIRTIRDNEKTHNKILKELYNKFTNQNIMYDNDITDNEENNEISKSSYKDNLEKALFGELDAVVKYRKILGAMPDRDSYILIMSIMTDELRHANKYNFLIHIAK